MSHFVGSKRRGSARAEMPAQLRVSHQPRVGPIPRFYKLRWAECEIEKVVIKDLAPIS
jgi:hypothetical protein